MNKVITYAMNLLSTLLVVGVFVIQHFEARKLGMVRWLNYHGQLVRSAIPLDAVKYVVLVLFVVVSAILLWQIIKRRKALHVSHVISVAFAILFVVAFAGAVAFVTRDVSHADFIIVGVMALATLLQVINLGRLARFLRLSA